MNEGPEFKIIGDANDEEKRKARKDLLNSLFNHFESLPPNYQEMVAKLEYPKSEKEIRSIDFANSETNRLLQKLGLSFYDIPYSNYHIIPPDLYKEITGSEGTAVTYCYQQGILFNAQTHRDNSFYFAILAFHETLHLKSFFSEEANIDDDGDIRITPYREGISIRARQKEGLHGKYHDHFLGLNEAIVTMQQKLIHRKLINLPFFKEERVWLDSPRAIELKVKAAVDYDVSIDDIIWIEEKENGDYDYKTFPYSGQRFVLEYICEEIQKQFPDQYHSFDEIFDEFLKSIFTGGLITVGRLVEKTFGSGSFRLLGMIDESDTSAYSVLEALKKARNRKLKN